MRALPSNAIHRKVRYRIRGTLVFTTLLLGAIGLGNGVRFTSSQSSLSRAVSDLDSECRHAITPVCAPASGRTSDDLAFFAIRRALSGTLSALGQSNLLTAFQTYLARIDSPLRFSGADFDHDMASIGGAAGAATLLYAHEFTGSIVLPHLDDRSNRFDTLLYPVPLQSCFTGARVPLTTARMLSLQVEAARRLFLRSSVENVLQNLQRTCDAVDLKKLSGLGPVCAHANLQFIDEIAALGDSPGDGLRDRFIRAFFDGLQSGTGTPAERSRAVCAAVEIPLGVAVGSAVRNFMHELVLSRTTVRALENSFYPPAARSSLQTFVDGAKRSLGTWFTAELGPRSGLGADRVNRMARELRDLPLNLPEPEDDSAFTAVGTFGQRMLPRAAEISDPLPDALEREHRARVSIDPSLVGFRFVNEFSMSFSLMEADGDTRLVELSPILPSISFLFQRNPEGAEMILSHELGHKFGPIRNRANGNDLAPALTPLLKCLGRNGDVAPFQYDEAVADWIGAKIMGRGFAERAPTDRPAGLARLAVPLCEMRAGEIATGAVPVPGEPHPLASTRLDSVIGSVPEIRAIRGCARSPGCDLGGEVIPK